MIKHEVLEKRPGSLHVCRDTTIYGYMQCMIYLLLVTNKVTEERQAQKRKAVGGVIAQERVRAPACCARSVVHLCLVAVFGAAGCCSRPM